MEEEKVTMTEADWTVIFGERLYNCHDTNPLMEEAEASRFRSSRRMWSLDTYDASVPLKALRSKHHDSVPHFSSPESRPPIQKGPNLALE